MKESYLGLHMPGDAELAPDYLRRLAKLVEEHIDLTALLQVFFIRAHVSRFAIGNASLLTLIDAQRSFINDESVLVHRCFLRSRCPRLP